MTPEETYTEIRADLAQTAKLQTQHAQAIAEIDVQIQTLVQSQNRYDSKLSRIDEIMHSLADAASANEERFAALADAQANGEQRLARIEGNFELFQAFVRDFRAETKVFFAETDRRLAILVDGLLRTDERVTALETNGRGKPKARAKKASKKPAAKKLPKR